jgi:O-antigen ligase
MWNDFRTRIPAINSWLLAAVFFTIPIQIAPAYIFTTLMLILWLLEGRFGEKWQTMKVEPLAWIFVAYYGVYLLSLLWTTDMAWGWRMVGKQFFFLLFPLYFTVARREHFWRYVAAFLLGTAMCEVFAYYNWLQLNVWPDLPNGIRADKNADDTAPFVDRIMYAPALALAGYLAGHQFLFSDVSRRVRVLYALLFMTTVINLVFSGGRAGLVGFFALLAVLVFQRFARKPFVAAITACLAVGIVCFAAYGTNSYFQKRLDAAISDIQHYDTRANTSVGLRITYAMNALRIFKSSPLVGIGAGDYPVEYQKMNARYTPQWKPAWNPHNQYLLALTSVGLIGGISVLLTLGYVLFRRNPQDGRQRIRIALPLLFIVICLFESYLMRSNTSMMYVVFSAALWRGVREPIV